MHSKENSVQQGSGLQNKRVVILGGSSGIGLAVAEQAASQGAQIVIASSNAGRVHKAVELCGERRAGANAGPLGRTGRRMSLYEAWRFRSLGIHGRRWPSFARPCDCRPPTGQTSL